MVGNEMSEEELQQRYADGEMTCVEYINQHDEDFRDEYYEFCEDESLDPNSENAALSFIEYREDVMDESMAN